MVDALLSPNPPPQRYCAPVSRWYSVSHPSTTNWYELALHFHTHWCQCGRARNWSYISTWRQYIRYMISTYFLRFYFIIFRKRKRWERNIDAREKHWLVAYCTCPDWGPKPQPRYVPWPGMKPVTFHFVEQCPTN